MRLSLLYCIFFLSLNTFAQTQLFFDNIGAEEKLLHGEVHAILCDSQGFMWFGTKGGLNRWDGYSMLSFRNNPEDSSSLSYNTVRALFEDSKGNIWVGTSGGGLNCFDRTTRTFERYEYSSTNKKGIANKNVYAIFEDSKKQLWVGTYGGGLQLFNYNEKTFTTFTHSYSRSNSIAGNSIRAITEDSLSNLWIACDGDGVSSYNLDTKKFTSYSHNPSNDNSLCSNATLSIYVDSDTAIYIGTWAGGISVLNPLSSKFKTIKHETGNENSLNSNEVFSIYKSQEGEFWFSTRAGVDIYNVQSKTFIHNKHNEFLSSSISNDFVTFIAEDNTGSIWIATGGGGVNKTNVNGYNFGYLRKEPLSTNTLLSQNVQCFATSGKELVWIGSNKGVQLYRYKDKKYESVNLNVKGLPANYIVKALVEDKFGNLWVGTEGDGLLHYNTITHTSTQYQFSLEKNSLANNSITSLCYDKSMHALWVGSYGGGLDHFNILTEEFENYPISAFVEVENVVFDIELLSNNQLLVATISNGLMVLNTEYKIFQTYGHDFKSKDFFRALSVTDICKSPQNGLWICSDEGIINPTDSAINVFKFENSQVGVIGASMQMDDSSRLWISSNQGMFLFNTKTQSFEANFVHHGIQSHTFNQRASVRLRDGSIWFGGIKGVNYFKPNELMPNELDGELVFTDFFINKNRILPQYIQKEKVSVNVVKHIHVPHTASSFSVDFAYLHYQSSHDNIYKYKLEGYDNDWTLVDGNNRTAHYSSLPYGSYKLKVQAANSDGVWLYKVAELDVFIEAPFWVKTWFYVITILIMLISIGFFLYRREKKNTKEKSILEEKLQIQQVVEKQKEDLEKLYSEMQSQNEEILVQDEYLKSVIGELQHKDQMVRHSFKYAERIQHAMLAKENDLNDFFSDYFVLYKPKDIVSGDFYWFTEEYDKDLDCKAYIFASVDCTGHGVPGAFLTIVSRFLLDKVIKHQKILDPSLILQELNSNVLSFFSQSVGKGNNDDGMDITVCRICTKYKKFIVASAMQKYAIASQENGFNVYDGDMFSIGDVFSIAKNPTFEKRVFDYQEGDTLYFFSDGYADQFGGEKKGKFMESRLFTMLEDNSIKGMAEQKEQLEGVMSEWKKGENQLDDIMVVGLKI